MSQVPFDEFTEEETDFMRPFIPPLRSFIVHRENQFGRPNDIEVSAHAIEYSTGVLAFVVVKLEARDGKMTAVQYTVGVFKDWLNVMELPVTKGVH